MPQNDREPVAWRGYARGPGTALTIGLLVLGAALLAHHLLQVDWAAMRGVMADMPRSALLAAGLLSAASYAVYCCFDLLGKRTTGHALDSARVVAIGFVSHACSLSLGPAGAGVRFRLAMRHGLPAHLVAALWIFNVASNWLGFMLITGTAFATQLFVLPDTWALGQEALRWLGVALLAALFAFLLACRFAHHRAWTVRGVSFSLPPAWVAALQCGLSALNWLLIAGVVHVLLRGQASFEQVLGAVMASAVALAIIDVPAGLGVTEAVFFALLGSQVGPTELLGALLAYRAIFFVAPLLLAALVYLLLEWDAHHRPAEIDSSPSRA
ncbi:Inner membrane protein YbhN [Burkholderiaceae bacterium]|nr:Inner membrane protein YbhN [Burkholderiaceae bacterium]